MKICTKSSTNDRPSMGSLGTVLEKVEIAIWNFVEQVISVLLPQVILAAAYTSQANILDDKSTNKSHLDAMFGPSVYFFCCSSMHSLTRNGNGKVTNLSQIMMLSLGNTASILAVYIYSYKIIGRLFHTTLGDAASVSYFFWVITVITAVNGVVNSDTGGPTPTGRTSKLQAIVMELSTIAANTAMGVCAGWFVGWLYNLITGHHVAVACFVSLAVALVAAVVNWVVNRNTSVFSTIERISTGQKILVVLINIFDHTATTAFFSGFLGWSSGVIPGYPVAVVGVVFTVGTLVAGLIDKPRSVTRVTSANDNTLTNCDEDVKVSSLDQDEVFCV